MKNKIKSTKKDEVHESLKVELLDFESLKVKAYEDVPRSILDSLTDEEVKNIFDQVAEELKRRIGKIVDSKEGYTLRETFFHTEDDGFGDPRLFIEGIAVKNKKL